MFDEDASCGKSCQCCEIGCQAQVISWTPHLGLKWCCAGPDWLSLLVEDRLQQVFWGLDHFSAGAQGWRCDAYPFQMAVEPAVACSQAEDGWLFQANELVDDALIAIVSCSFVGQGGLPFVLDQRFGFLVCNFCMRLLLFLPSLASRSALSFPRMPV